MIVEATLRTRCGCEKKIAIPALWPQVRVPMFNNTMAFTAFKNTPPSDKPNIEVRIFELRHRRYDDDGNGITVCTALYEEIP